MKTLAPTPNDNAKTVEGEQTLGELLTEIQVISDELVKAEVLYENIVATASGDRRPPLLTWRVNSPREDGTPYLDLKLDLATLAPETLMAVATDLSIQTSGRLKELLTGLHQAAGEALVILNRDVAASKGKAQ